MTIDPQHFKFCVEFGYIQTFGSTCRWAENERKTPLMKDEVKKRISDAGKCMRCRGEAEVTYDRPYCEPCRARTIEEEKIRAREERQERERLEKAERDKREAEARELARNKLPKNWSQAAKQQWKEKEIEEKREERLKKKRAQDKYLKDQLKKSEANRNIKNGYSIDRFVSTGEKKCKIEEEEEEEKE